MSNIIVLGAGMVGSAIALDMAETHHVTLTDLNKSVLGNAKLYHKQVTTLQLDVCISLINS